MRSNGRAFHRRYLRKDADLPRCPEVHTRFGAQPVVWFGEQLSRKNWNELKIFSMAELCDVVIVAGTTATFGYITIGRSGAAGMGAELIEVNPEETPVLTIRNAAMCARRQRSPCRESSIS